MILKYDAWIMSMKNDEKNHGGIWDNRIGHTNNLIIETPLIENGSTSLVFVSCGGVKFKKNSEDRGGHVKTSSGMDPLG